MTEVIETEIRTYMNALFVIHAAHKEINPQNLAKVLTAAGVATNVALVEAYARAFNSADIEAMTVHTPQQTSQAPVFTGADVKQVDVPQEAPKEAETKNDSDDDDDDIGFGLFDD
ncbi:hypothetical protein ACOME3_010188 [Neoechinorhynchus agilis]